MCAFFFHLCISFLPSIIIIMNFFFIFAFESEPHIGGAHIIHTLAPCVVPQQPLTPLAFYSHRFLVCLLFISKHFFFHLLLATHFFLLKMKLRSYMCLVIYDRKWKNPQRRTKKHKHHEWRKKKYFTISDHILFSTVILFTLLTRRNGKNNRAATAAAAN